MSLIDSAGQINQDILAGTMVAVGLFVTFFGARFFKYMVFFVGFIIGAFLTYYSIPIIWSWFNSTIADDTLLYISLTVGALCGVLLVVVYKAAVFSCGAICGAVFSQILWIAVVANIDTEGKDWLTGVQIGVLVVFALVGGWLAFKFVEQVLKGITAFVGGFMFASGIAYFVSRLDRGGGKNVIDWVVFFGSYENYANLEAACDVYCIVCFVLWLILFAAGCFVQYKLHKKHKRKDHDNAYKDGSDSECSYSDSDSDTENRHKHRDDSSSDDSGSESSRRSKKKSKKKKDKVENGSYKYDEPERMAVGGFAGSQYGHGQSLRQNYAKSEGHGESKPHPPRGAPPVAMSTYDADYHSANPNIQMAPGGAPPDQYGNFDI